MRLVKSCHTESLRSPSQPYFMLEPIENHVINCVSRVLYCARGMLTISTSNNKNFRQLMVHIENNFQIGMTQVKHGIFWIQILWLFLVILVSILHKMGIIGSQLSLLKPQEATRAKSFLV